MCHPALRNPTPPSESVLRLASPFSMAMMPHLEGMRPPSKTCSALRSYHESRALDVAVTAPRACKRQTQRANAPAENAEEHYRLNIFLPVVDAVNSQQTRRFPYSYPGKNLLVIPSRLGDREVKTVLTAAETYEADLPTTTCLGPQLVSWRVRWAQVTDVDKHSSALKALNRCNPETHSNIQALLKLLSTLPLRAALQNGHSALSSV